MYVSSERAGHTDFHDFIRFLFFLWIKCNETLAHILDLDHIDWWHCRFFFEGRGAQICQTCINDVEIQHAEIVWQLNRYFDIFCASVFMVHRVTRKLLIFGRILFPLKENQNKIMKTLFKIFFSRFVLYLKVVCSFHSICFGWYFFLNQNCISSTLIGSLLGWIFWLGLGAQFLFPSWWKKTVMAGCCDWVIRNEAKLEH